MSTVEYQTESLHWFLELRKASGWSRKHSRLWYAWRLSHQCLTRCACMGPCVSSKTITMVDRTTLFRILMNLTLYFTSLLKAPKYMKITVHSIWAETLGVEETSYADLSRKQIGLRSTFDSSGWLDILLLAYKRLWPLPSLLHIPSSAENLYLNVIMFVSNRVSFSSALAHPIFYN